MLRLNRESLIFWFLFGFLLIFAAFRPVGFDSDTIGYMAWLELDIYKEMAEPSFGIIVDFWAFLIPDEYIARMVLVTYAGLNMFFLKSAFEGFSNRRIQAFIFYFLLVYSIFTLTQIRIGLASSVFFWALIDVLNNRRRGFVFKMMLAISFHYMMIVFIPFYFINSNKKPIWFFLILAVAAFFAAIFTAQLFVLITDQLLSLNILPTYVASKLVSYLNLKGDDISVFNFHLAFTLLIYVLALVKSATFDQKDFFLLKCVGYGLILYFLTTFMTTMSGRVLNIVVMMSIVLIPGVCRAWRRDKELIYSIIVISAFLLFINTHVRNNLLDFGVLF